MASTTYRVIQEPAHRGTFTSEQVADAIRAAIATLAKKAAPSKKPRAVGKKTRSQSKS